MATFKEQLEALAERWEQQGRAEALLLRGWDFVRAYCWSGSAAASREPLSEWARALLSASRAAMGGAYDGILNERDSCRRCGTPYRVENLSLCTSCDLLFCPSCASKLSLRSNDNRACPCGGEIVG